MVGGIASCCGADIYPTVASRLLVRIGHALGDCMGSRIAQATMGSLASISAVFLALRTSHWFDHAVISWSNSMEANWGQLEAHLVKPMIAVTAAVIFSLAAVVFFTNAINS